MGASLFCGFCRNERGQGQDALGEELQGPGAGGCPCLSGPCPGGLGQRAGGQHRGGGWGVDSALIGWLERGRCALRWGALSLQDVADPGKVKTQKAEDVITTSDKCNFSVAGRRGVH